MTAKSRAATIPAPKAMAMRCIIVELSRAFEAVRVRSDRRLAQPSRAGRSGAFDVL
jgi:hypothetical protein